MQRLIYPAALAAALVGADLALAQGAWPAYPAGPGDHDITRGPGFYFALYKLVLLAIPFLLWVKSTGWIASDLDEFGKSIEFKPEVWNPIQVFPFLLTFVLITLSIPIFFVGYPLLLIAWLAPMFTYIVLRDKKMTADQKVLSPENLKETFLNLLNTKRKKKTGPAKQPWELGPPVDLSATGPLQNLNQAAMIDARQNPAFVPVKTLIADALRSRADKIRLDYTADAVAVKYQIDGVWMAANPKVHEKEPFNRALGDPMLVVLKRLAHLKPEDRRSQQKGKFQTVLDGNKYETTLTSQGTPTGEAAMISFAIIIKTTRSLEELGMREKMREQLKEQLSATDALIVISSMPGDGLSATWVGALKASDRLLRDFVAIEDANKREPEVENVEINKYDSTKGEKPEDLMPKMILRQPDVYIVPEITSGELLTTICWQCHEENKMAVVSTRAREAVEALLRLLALKPDPEKYIPTVKAVLNQRLIRKLCDSCREAVPLTPELAQRLRIPAGRVQFLYREKQPPPPGQEPPKKKGEPEICPKCRGLGYFGRTAIYELLIVNDAMRQALQQQPKVEVLRQLAAKAHHPSLQEEGILLVAAGVTSLAELQRVLKQ